MQQYFFVLGRNPEISIAEIKAVFRLQSLPCKVLQTSETILRVESNPDLNIPQLNAMLGGTVKIGKVIESLPLDSIEDIEKLFTLEVLQNGFIDPELTKIEFGVSIYSCNGAEAEVKRMFAKHETLIRAIKEELENYRIKAHFPQMREKVLSSASVEKNRLIRKGAEIVCIVTHNALIIGKTLVVQEFESFSKRDFGRPVRDMKSGVMPPKLARMMINLAEKNTSKVILDPFCGSGTILQEALELGFRDIIGTDLADKAITDTRNNISWYTNRFKVEDAEIRIEKADVTKLSSIIKDSSVDAIVTEPYLGPTLRNFPQLNLVQNTIQELSVLYRRAFQEFGKVLTNKGTVIIILPVFNVRRHLVHMDILEKLDRYGLSQEPLSASPRRTIVVGNSRDYVLREVVKLVRV